VVQELLKSIEALANALEKISAIPSANAWKGLTEVVQTYVPDMLRYFDRYVNVISAGLSEPITCGANCGSCCSHYVTSVEPFESLYLHLELRRRPDYGERLFKAHRNSERYSSLLREALSEFKETEKDGYPADDAAADKALHRYFRKGIACPMLGPTGSCEAYEQRPYACRMYLSLSHPRFCKGKAWASPENRNFIVELPDEVETALASCPWPIWAKEVSPDLFRALLDWNELSGPWGT
jgi:Fe-S-cluster containining protein